MWLSFGKYQTPFTTGMFEEIGQIEGIFVASIDAKCIFHGLHITESAINLI
jgi:hypothetical protein